MANNRFLKIAAVLGGVFFLSNWLKNRTLNKITYSAGGFRVHKITASSIEFRMVLRVTNQSDVPAPVTAFIGQLLYRNANGTIAVLGDLTQVAPVELPGFGSANIEFSMVSGLLGSAWEILNILTNGNPTDPSKINYANVDFKRFLIKGTLKVGVLPVDIETTLA